MLVNSSDRIIRVVDMPDLSILLSSTSSTQNGNGTTTPLIADDDLQHDGIDPNTLPENIHLHTTHKFQDLVNRLRWNDCAFSHISAASSGTSTVDYITASTYMKRDIYIWELTSNSLLRILENKQEPAIIEWHPTRPLLACTGIETGIISIYGIEVGQKWSALAPEFTEVTENVEYVEREDEFGKSPIICHSRSLLHHPYVDFCGQPQLIRLHIHSSQSSSWGFPQTSGVWGPVAPRKHT